MELCSCKIVIMITSVLFASLLAYISDYSLSIPAIIFITFLCFYRTFGTAGHKKCEWQYQVMALIVFNVCYCIIVIAVFIGRYISISAYCFQFECCTGKWILPNITGLSFELNRKLYGQHLVIGPTVKHLRGRMEGNPQKPLVFSFHGTSGTGKNFVSNLLAEHMYLKGTRSQYVHHFSVTRDFIHDSKLEEYKISLKTSIETAVKQCPQSLFIIDEMDKMPRNLINILKPYLDFNHHADGTDYRKATFIFLSNTAGNEIAKSTVDHLAEGFQRHKLTLKELENVIRLAIYNTGNAFWHSDLIRNNLITAYIPFLPLEKTHVEQCIVAGLFLKGFYDYEHQVDRGIVREIADELTYFPKEAQTFSTTGCKRVFEKIDLVMQQEE